MSLAMVFGATDGLLVLADGREVALTDEPGVYEWHRDDSVKLFTAPDATSLAVIAVGRVDYGDTDVMEVVRATFNDAPDPGPTWTPKTLARAVNYRLSDLDSLHGNWFERRVVALAVGYEPGDTEPQVWHFGVDPLSDIDYEDVDPDLIDGKEPPEYRYSALVEGDDLAFKVAPFARIPSESAAGDAIWHDIDDTHRLNQGGAENDDPRYLQAYQLTDMSLHDIRREVVARLAQLIRTDTEAFRLSQVGGRWLLAEVRPGTTPVVTELALGPFEPGHTPPGQDEPGQDEPRQGVPGQDEPVSHPDTQF